jgi:hypothetical protein
VGVVKAWFNLVWLVDYVCFASPFKRSFEMITTAAPTLTHRVLVVYTKFGYQLVLGAVWVERLTRVKPDTVVDVNITVASIYFGYEVIVAYTNNDGRIATYFSCIVRARDGEFVGQAGSQRIARNVHLRVVPIILDVSLQVQCWPCYLRRELGMRPWKFNQLRIELRTWVA